MRVHSVSRRWNAVMLNLDLQVAVSELFSSAGDASPARLELRKKNLELTFGSNINRSLCLKEKRQTIEMV